MWAPRAPREPKLSLSQSLEPAPVWHSSSESVSESHRGLSWWQAQMWKEARGSVAGPRDSCGFPIS